MPEDYNADNDSFDLSDAPDDQPVAPKGEYHVKIVDGEVKDTKTGGGKYVNYRTVIQAGEYTGFTVYGMWTLKPSSGKQDTRWMMKKDLIRLGLDPANFSIATVRGLEGIASVSLGDKRDRDGEVVGKENKIKSWVGAL